MNESITKLSIRFTGINNASARILADALEARELKLKEFNFSLGNRVS